ncbi:hypothetical protein C1646_823064 [Rhizophagus diaphanus]|nr:hypothetical protein C1646_823064 [Rhizophagus diaphanus] [Rhizophagus sp. MUCL 43196]
MTNRQNFTEQSQTNEIVLFTEADSVPKSLDEEEIVDIVNKYQKSALSNHISKDVSNTNSHVTPDKNCSSRLPEIKKKKFQRMEKLDKSKVVRRKWSEKNNVKGSERKKGNERNGMKEWSEKEQWKNERN